MKHARSNTNLLKKINGGKNKKTNIFKKASGHQNFNYINSNNQTGRKNYLISLLDKNTTPTNFNSNKFNINSKKNREKQIYLTSAIESKNNNIENGNKSRGHHGNINIRLNLNNEIINNNFNNYNTSIKNKNFHKSKSNINVNDKIKEKDKLITKLQKELLQSQEFLNQLQKDKQNELTVTYNTIKNIDNLNKNISRSLTALLNTPSLLTFNYKNKNKVNKNDYNFFNSGFYSTNNRKYKITSSTTKPNYIRCFSSSPRRLFSCNIENVDSNNSNKFNKKANKNINIINNSNTNIKINKNNEKPSLNDIYFTRQTSHSNYNNNINHNYDFKDKCQKLKKRAKLLLNSYILLIKEHENIKEKDKKKKII